MLDLAALWKTLERRQAIIFYNKAILNVTVKENCRDVWLSFMQ